MDCKAVHKLRSVISGVDLGASDAAPLNQNAWNTGFQPIDNCLPACGLNRHGLHEIEPLKPTHMPALTGFTFALLSRLRSAKPIIWCVTTRQIGDYGRPYAFGFSRFGISPSQIIFAKVNRDRDLPFALEEAIKTDGIAAVIGEGERPCFTGSRRIALLCKTHKTPCILMSPHKNEHAGSSALTRWQIAPQQGLEDPRDPFGPGLPAWAVALPRVRSGHTTPLMDVKNISNSNTTYPWRIAWDEQTLSFRSTALLCKRTTQQNQNAGKQAPKAMVGRRNSG